MKFLKHLLENPFITFTGLAALVHSTWSLGTLFSGVAPSSNWGEWAAWVLPAFFIAFAMDVGQISTSAKIRHFGLNWQRGLAFFVFSVATYYLQFLYIAHHMPSLEIAEGVSEFHRFAVVTARDASIWILPLLLPLSTMLYTISDGDNKEQPRDSALDSIGKVKNHELPAIATPEEELVNDVTSHIAHCDDCGWAKECVSDLQASRALRTHQSLHCTVINKEKVIASNGHVN